MSPSRWRWSPNRARREPSEDDVSPPPPQPQPSNRRSERAPRETDDDEETEEQEEEQETSQTGLEMEPTVKDADESRLDVDALLAAFEDATRRSFAEKSTRGTMTGRTKRQSVFDLTRGRYVKAIFPKGGHIRGKIAADATLRACRRDQLFRRRRHSDGTARRVFITKDDVRLKKLSRRAASLTIFLVDASGSMAINRITVAKAAAEDSTPLVTRNGTRWLSWRCPPTPLWSCYHRRDRRSRRHDDSPLYLAAAARRSRTDYAPRPSPQRRDRARKSTASRRARDNPHRRATDRLTEVVREPKRASLRTAAIASSASRGDARRRRRATAARPLSQDARRRH